MAQEYLAAKAKYEAAFRKSLRSLLQKAYTKSVEKNEPLTFKFLRNDGTVSYTVVKHRVLCLHNKNDGDSSNYYVTYRQFAQMELRSNELEEVAKKILKIEED